MKVHDPLLPASSVLVRLEGHRDAAKDKLDTTPWWKFRDRLILKGVIAAYDYEIEQLLEITASWQPFWDEIK